MLLTVLLPVAPAMDWRRTFPGRADQAHEVRATKSGQGGSFTVGLFHTGGRTSVSVADEGGPAEPAVAEAGEWSECGRGLRTVSVLADSWGWHGDDTERTVTAIFATPAGGR
jgi:hypothetical protein